jgi:hypothetical protein
MGPRIFTTFTAARFKVQAPTPLFRVVGEHHAFFGDAFDINVRYPISPYV